MTSHGTLENHWDLFLHFEFPRRTVCYKDPLGPNSNLTNCVLQTYYLVGFEPLAEAKIAHHMLLYGCKTPGKTDPLFNCGTMTARQEGE